MLVALKNLPQMVDGLSSTRMLAGPAQRAAGGRSGAPGSSWSDVETEDTEPMSPQGDAMKHESTKPADDSIASALAQMAQGLAQSYADRARPERTGRLHRV
jgi:hypothetical protein